MFNAQIAKKRFAKHVEDFNYLSNEKEIKFFIEEYVPVGEWPEWAKKLWFKKHLNNSERYTLSVFLYHNGIPAHAVPWLVLKEDGYTHKDQDQVIDIGVKYLSGTLIYKTWDISTRSPFDSKADDSHLLEAHAPIRYNKTVHESKERVSPPEEVPEPQEERLSMRDNIKQLVWAQQQEKLYFERKRSKNI